MLSDREESGRLRARPPENPRTSDGFAESAQSTAHLAINVLSMCTGRQQIKCHCEDQINHQHEHTDELGRSSTARDQRSCHSCNQHHYHRARPELHSSAH